MHIFLSCPLFLNAGHLLEEIMTAISSYTDGHKLRRGTRNPLIIWYFLQMNPFCASTNAKVKDVAQRGQDLAPWHPFQQEIWVFFCNLLMLNDFLQAHVKVSLSVHLLGRAKKHMQMLPFPN